jgi:outer membrane protein assembly factor BamE (lipoprotein component of BamABCDE complex)
MRRAGLLIISALVLVTFSACSGQIRNHGYMPAPDQVADVLVGVDTRASVEEQLGLPTTEGLIEQAAYFYVRSRLQNKGLRGAKEIDRNILVISFDKNDVVKNIQRFNMSDGQIVALQPRVTLPPREEKGMFSRILLSIGSPDAASVLNE